MTRESSFSQIYANYFKRIYNFIFSKTRSQDDTEDIVQETFTGIWRSLDKIDQEKNLTSWVYQIARNKLNDYLKRKYKISEKSTLLSLDNISEEDLDKYDLDNEDKSYLDHAHNKATKLIEKLEDKYRKVLELRYLKNYKISDVSRELNITENNVKVIQNRAIKKLKELLNNN